MPSIAEICSETRLLLDEPRAQKPSGRRVLQAVISALQTFYSRLENTGQSWSLKPDYSLAVSSNTSDYLLAIDGTYGKPVQVLTTYLQNPSYIARYVELREFPSMNFDWPWPVNAASWVWNYDGSNCTASRMAFYYKDDGSRWVRVLPQPALTAIYLVTFASGDWANNAALEASPVLSQFHSLVETWAALSALPSTEWWDDVKLNMDHRKEIAASLKNDEGRIAEEFDRYCRNLVLDQIGTRQSSFDGNGGLGWY